MVHSAFRRHIDAQLFWSISPSEQRPSLSLKPTACEKWERDETMHFNLSMPLYLRGRKKGCGGDGACGWGGRGVGEQEGCTSSNPASASLMQLLTINHTIGCCTQQIDLWPHEGIYRASILNYELLHMHRCRTIVLFQSQSMTSAHHSQ